MLPYEAKIRSDAQKILDALGFSHLHVKVYNRSGALTLAKKCGNMFCVIPTISISDRTVRDDVGPIVSLIDDWLNENFKGILDLTKAEEEFAKYLNQPAPKDLPKGVTVRSGGYGLQITYQNYKMKGYFFWDIKKDGEITKFRYDAPTRIKDRVPYNTWSRRKPEKAHIDQAAAIRTWWAQRNSREDKVHKLRENLNSCEL